MNRTRILATLVAVAVIGGAGYGLWYLFLRPAPPAAVTIATPSPAAAATDAPGTTAAPGTTDARGTTDPGTGGELDGRWTVDTSVGSFGDFSGTWVGYRVQEELASIGATEAVGRTPDVSGSLTVSGSSITAVDIVADLTTLQSDDDRRDGQLGRQGLQTDQFPEGRFVLSAPIDLGALPGDGESVSATASGELTLHGQTVAVQVPVEASRSGDVVTVKGTLAIPFADWGMEAPNSFVVLSIADTGTMEFQVHFTRS